MVIYKYKISNESVRIFHAPPSAEILDINTQNNEIYMWIYLDPTEKPIIPWAIYLVYTGETLPEEINYQHYIETVHQVFDNKNIVAHIFVKKAV